MLLHTRLSLKTKSVLLFDRDMLQLGRKNC